MQNMFDAHYWLVQWYQIGLWGAKSYICELSNGFHFRTTDRDAEVQKKEELLHHGDVVFQGTGVVVIGPDPDPDRRTTDDLQVDEVLPSTVALDPDLIPLGAFPGLLLGGMLPEVLLQQKTKSPWGILHRRFRRQHLERGQDVGTMTKRVSV